MRGLAEDPVPGIAPSEFASLIGRLGPFEPAPEIAVACSGGPDSMALAVLAADWAASQGGRATALIVDHGLRTESAAEALGVRSRLRKLGIAAHILRWCGEKPATGIQNAARAARYDLFEGWCRGHGVLHLMVAHHREDQAETVLHREERSSGPDGLAGMPAIRETPSLRLLRPLLAIPRERLREVLAARRIGWVEDPSNRDPAFARVRLRLRACELAADGKGPEAVAETARRRGRERRKREIGVAEALAGFGTLHPEGYAALARDVFAAVGRETACRALDALVCAVGGRTYPLRREALARLCDELSAPGFIGRRTLGGCHLRMARDGLLIARESARIRPVAVREGDTLLWDGRFRVRLADPAAGVAARDFTLAPLDVQSLVETGDDEARAAAAALPHLVRLSLPAFYDRRGLLSVPHLNYGRARRNTASVRPEVAFLPVKPATSAVFPVA